MRRAIAYEYDGVGDRAEAEAIFDPQVVLNPIDEVASSGFDAMRADMEGWASAFDELKVTIEEIIDAGDQAVVVATPGARPGKRGRRRYALLRGYTLREGKVAEWMSSPSVPRPSKPWGCRSRHEVRPLCPARKNTGLGSPLGTRSLRLSTSGAIVPRKPRGGTSRWRGSSSPAFGGTGRRTPRTLRLGPPPPNPPCGLVLPRSPRFAKREKGPKGRFKMPDGDLNTHSCAQGFGPSPPPGCVASHAGRRGGIGVRVPPQPPLAHVHTEPRDSVQWEPLVQLRASTGLSAVGGWHIAMSRADRAGL